MSKNDITGDSIITKPSSKYAEGWERIFGPDKCEISKISSRICQKGTECCIVDHKPIKGKD